jgi:hypothetical protein
MGSYKVSHKSAATELYYLENMEKCKERKVVASHLFPISSVGILPRTSRYGAEFFTLSIVKSYGYVATLT